MDILTSSCVETADWLTGIASSSVETDDWMADILTSPSVDLTAVWLGSLASLEVVNAD